MQWMWICKLYVPCHQHDRRVFVTWQAKVLSLKELAESEAEAVEAAAESEEDGRDAVGELGHGDGLGHGNAPAAAAVVVHHQGDQAGQAETEAENGEADDPVAGERLVVGGEADVGLANRNTLVHPLDELVLG